MINFTTNSQNSRFLQILYFIAIWNNFILLPHYSILNTKHPTSQKPSAKTPHNVKLTLIYHRKGSFLI